MTTQPFTEPRNTSPIGARLRSATTTLRRAIGVTVALLGMATVAQPTLANEGGEQARQGVRQQLQQIDGKIQQCLEALNGAGPNLKLDDLLAEMMAKAGEDSFDPSTAASRIQALPGDPVSLTVDDLEVCAAAIHAQSQVAKSAARAHPQAPATVERLVAEARSQGETPSGVYPNCPSDSTSCPNPTGPGGLCCNSDEYCASSCGAEGGNCVAECYPKLCFPSDATVRLENGAMKTMGELRIGDRVQVALADGSIAFEEIYLMTHKDAAVATSYLKVSLASGKTLTLSPRHFIPTATDGLGGWETRLVKGADELNNGDRVWYLDDNGTMASSTVSGITRIVGNGAFNPMTTSGSIIVDGVVASAHSDWFLDGIVSADTQAAVYQALFAPVRGIYRVIGPENMITVTEEWGVVDFIRDWTSQRALGLLLLLALLSGAMTLVVRGALRWKAAHRRMPGQTS